MQMMTTEHPRWAEFYRHLSEMADFITCQHTMNAVEVSLVDAFGFSAEEVAASIEYFKVNRACCDCEVLLRFGTKAMDDLARLREMVQSIERRLGYIETAVRPK